MKGQLSKLTRHTLARRETVTSILRTTSVVTSAFRLQSVNIHHEASNTLNQRRLENDPLAKTDESLQEPRITNNAELRELTGAIEITPLFTDAQISGANIVEALSSRISNSPRRQEAQGEQTDVISPANNQFPSSFHALVLNGEEQTPHIHPYGQRDVILFAPNGGYIAAGKPTTEQEATSEEKTKMIKIKIPPGGVFVVRMKERVPHAFLRPDENSTLAAVTIHSNDFKEFFKQSLAEGTLFDPKLTEEPDVMARLTTVIKNPQMIGQITLDQLYQIQSSTILRPSAVLKALKENPPINLEGIQADSSSTMAGTTDQEPQKSFATKVIAGRESDRGEKSK